MKKEDEERLKPKCDKCGKVPSEEFSWMTFFVDENGYHKLCVECNNKYHENRRRNGGK